MKEHISKSCNIYLVQTEIIKGSLYLLLVSQLGSLSDTHGYIHTS